MITATKLRNEDDFWSKINQLQQTLLSKNFKLTAKDEFSSDEKKPSVTVDECSVKIHERNLVKEIQAILERCTCEESSDTSLLIPNRKIWKNTNFDVEHGIKLKEKPSLVSLEKDKHTNKRYGLTIHLLKKIHSMLKTNKYCTKRELYYEDIRMYSSQTVVDSILDDISCMLNVQKIHLHLTTSKGIIAGNLQFKDADGNYIDISETDQGHQLPNDIDGITDICSSARFILIIEKDAVFQSLIDDNFTKILHPCVIITGKGFPDVNTRNMVHKLYDILQIPVLALVDADPYGIEILSIYAYGSMSMSFDVSNLTVPQIRWLGLLPSDIQNLNLPKSDVLHLSEHDKKRAVHLLERPYMNFRDEWRQQVQLLLQTNIKAEIEILNRVSDRFLTSTYLPKKIKYGGWI